MFHCNVKINTKMYNDINNKVVLHVHLNLESIGWWVTVALRHFYVVIAIITTAEMPGMYLFFSGSVHSSIYPECVLYM